MCFVVTYARRASSRAVSMIAKQSQHCATARGRVAELEMIELDGLEHDDIMKLRIVVFNMMERRLAKTSSFFQE